MPTDNRAENGIRAHIEGGVVDYYREEEAQSDSEIGLLREGLNYQFTPLDKFLNTLEDPETTERALVKKWTTLVDLAKSYGVDDYGPVDALRALVIGKVIQRNNTFDMSLQHEKDEGGDAYYDVIRLITETNSARRPSVHRSRGGSLEVPDLNTPLPILKPEVVEALKGILPNEVVELPEHNRRRSTGEAENLWRISARAEYLSALRTLKKAGVDLVAIAKEVLVNSTGVEELDGFLAANDGLTLRELAERWGEEEYAKPQPSDMQKALHHQDQIQAEIRNNETDDLPDLQEVF